MDVLLAAEATFAENRPRQEVCQWQTLKIAMAISSNLPWQTPIVALTGVVSGDAATTLIGAIIGFALAEKPWQDVKND